MRNKEKILKFVKLKPYQYYRNRRVELVQKEKSSLGN